MSDQTKPCGGCGEADPAKRCIGCLHDFGDQSSEWVKGSSVLAPPAKQKQEAA